uniref:Uncharacterized protein n=1 Tax=Anopheles quadriannulatus TaxID=34691 RepID=A0A182WZC9_ANOQN
GASSSPEQSTYHPVQVGSGGGASATPVGSKFRCDQCNISFDDEEAAAAAAASDAGGACKLEDVSTSGTEGSIKLSSSALEGVGSGSNSNSSSSFDYSSSMSHTEGTEQSGGPSSDEPSGHFAIRKSGSSSPSFAVGANEAGQQVGADEEEEEEEEENDEEEDETTDDGDRKQMPRYESMGPSSFDQSLQRAYGGGVAPALLAAASIAAAVENGCTEVKYCPELKQQRSISPVQPSALSITRNTPPPSSGSSSSSSSSSTSSVLSMTPSGGTSSTLLEPAGSSAPSGPSAGQFVYEPMAIMKHHGYFAPASQITEFRSSSDIVRQVEAAIAGTENLLTPPRSSPESPDRSSSPESDSVLMADRDNNTLPPRKRKLYFKDSQHTVSTGPKMASLEATTPQHYGVTVVQQQQPTPQHHQQQQPPLDAHSGHQQLFHPHQQQQQQQQQQVRQLHYQQQQRPEDERSMKLEVLQHVSACQRQPSPTLQAPAAPPQQPQQTSAPSVIRMSSVIQYANKSS